MVAWWNSHAAQVLGADHGARLISFTGLGGEVTARLREDILSGRYKDGEHLTERNISDEVRS